MSDAPVPVSSEGDAPVASAEFKGLPDRARWLFHLRSLSRLFFGWTPVTVVGGGALGSQVGWEWGLGAAAAGWALGFVWAVWMPAIAFDRWAYRLGATEVTVTNGVLIKTVSAIPFQRVQYVDVRQGLLDQLFGLATLRIHTASGLGVDAAIPGLDATDAEKLREELVARAKGDDGV